MGLHVDRDPVGTVMLDVPASWRARGECLWFTLRDQGDASVGRVSVYLASMRTRLQTPWDKRDMAELFGTWLPLLGLEVYATTQGWEF